MARVTIDLTGPLKRSAARGVRVIGPDVVLAFDDEAITRVLATAIAEQSRTNMRSGLAPDGSPLPAAAAATIRRRLAAGVIGRLWGVASGLLASSIHPVRVGNLWGVGVIGSRGIRDAGGGSPAERVFAKIASWSEAGQRQPSIVAALRRILTNIIRRSSR